MLCAFPQVRVANRRGRSGSDFRETSSRGAPTVLNRVIFVSQRAAISFCVSNIRRIRLRAREAECALRAAFVIARVAVGANQATIIRIKETRPSISLFSETGIAARVLP
jgi:hypothetical protein